MRILKEKLYNEQVVCTASKALAKNENLRFLLKKKLIFHRFSIIFSYQTFIGWGRKPSGQKAVLLSKAHKKNFILLEDGFLRSFFRLDESLSFVFDNQGIYYDATVPSQLERYIIKPLSNNQQLRSQELINRWKVSGVSKYNGLPSYFKTLPNEYILVIDQVKGDLSIEYGMANEFAFKQMLATALADHPKDNIVVKTHPDLINSKKCGHYDLNYLNNHPRIIVVSEPCHCVSILEKAKQVYVVTSQIGFEALIWGKPVKCFGMPFYAGWGLTNDTLKRPSRRKDVALEQLVHASLIDYPRYLNPLTQVECQIEDIIVYMSLRMQHDRQFPDTAYALGFSSWKQRHLKHFLSGTHINFIKNSDLIPKSATVFIWGTRFLNKVKEHKKVIQVEDGFLRSAGLGADLIQPLSWVFDEYGLYYDSSKVSKLEMLLQTTSFNDALLMRAKSLRLQCLSQQVTKYNLSGRIWNRPVINKRVLLVVGQVETDASIGCGSPYIKSNFELLTLVRHHNPDAYILYKPHPDVEAGLRQKGKNELNATIVCDEIVSHVSSHNLLTQIDELHTMTSLMGFEALLRGIKVVCYGQPFYSSWGLTIDRYPVTRRTKQLTLDELVAGVLILYPTYLSRKTKLLATPEVVVQELSTWKAQGGSTMSLWRRMLRTVLQVWSRFPKKQQV